MSLLNFEDRKIFLKNNYNNKNQKKTYNKNMRKNNQKKIFLGINQEHIVVLIVLPKIKCYLQL